MTKKLDAGNSKKPSSASITRRKRTTWTTVDNSIINDTTLNLKALGLLTYMLSKPDAWVFSQAQIGAAWGEGKESMQSAMRRLTECGYVQRETVRDEKGHLRTITVVSEEPIPLSERVASRCRVSRLPVQPALVNPADGKPGTLVKTDLKKRLIEEVVSKKPTQPEALSPAKLATKPPVCPVNEIVAVYHDTLPELPSVRVMDDDRIKGIKSRWVWVMTTNKPDGTPRATTKAQGIDWFTAYFNRARDNDFLMGRGARAEQHKNWKCDIDFLMTMRGIKQVIEKTESAS